MPRIMSLATALVAAVILLVPAASAGARADSLSHRLANVPAQTRQTLSAVVTPSANAVDLSVFYLCTSRRGGNVTVAPTFGNASETRRARCDGRAHRMVFEANTEALFTVVTVKQGTSARAGFSVWE